MLLLLALVLSCSPAKQGPLRFSVRFACDAVAQRADQVRVAISRGKCPGQGPLLYAATVFRSEGPDARAPDTLQPGLYAFRAAAFDARGVTIAESCRAVTFPGAHAVLLDLDAATTCVGLEKGESWDISPNPAGAAPVNDALAQGNLEISRGTDGRESAYPVTFASKSR